MRRPTGFTLLEVMLSLVIAGVVLAALGMAVDFHLRVLEKGRQETEEAQLARALLRRMADDLRSAVRYQPIDVEGMLGGSIESAAGAALGEAGDAFTEEGSRGEAAAASEAASMALTAEDALGEAESTSIAESTTVPSTPGLYGTALELQVDVSRLPRIDQYQQMISAEGFLMDRVSDVKSVAYYVADETIPLSSGEIGLVRREMDRAATAWASEEGDPALLEVHPQLMAPEVVGLEFSYFDGTEWAIEWDSTERGGLPVAVQISLALAPPIQNASGGSLLFSADATMPLDDVRVYSLLVYLPGGEPTSLDSATTTEDGFADPEASTSEEPLP